MPQDRQSCFGSPPLEAPWLPTSDGRHIRSLQRPTTSVHASGSYQQDGGFRLATNFGIVGTRRDKLGHPPTLVTAVWGRTFGATEYYWGVWVLGSQRTPTLGGLQGADVGLPHQTRKVPWSLESWSRGDLATDAGEVCAGGDMSRCQIGLWGGSTLRGVGGRD